MAQLKPNPALNDALEAEEVLEDYFADDSSPEVRSVLEYRRKRLLRGEELLSEDAALSDLRRSRYGEDAA